jgi:hypothetical protein
MCLAASKLKTLSNADMWRQVKTERLRRAHHAIPSRSA